MDKKAKVLTNRWNRIRYTIHSIYYDKIVKLTESPRKRGIEVLNINPTDRILIVGAGTGLDLQFLLPSQFITAVDITPAMLAKLDIQKTKLGMNVNALIMDGQNLDFVDNIFDCVILNFILSVIDNPNQCLKEASRVLKKEGRILIVDKFLDEKENPTFIRRLFSPIISFLFSELNRRFSDIYQGLNLKIEFKEKDPKLKGFIVIYVLRK